MSYACPAMNHLVIIRQADIMSIVISACRLCAPLLPVTAYLCACAVAAKVEAKAPAVPNPALGDVKQAASQATQAGKVSNTLLLC